MNSTAVRFAVVRPVPNSYDRCVRTSAEEINVKLARLQHEKYCKQLEGLGLKLVWVEGDDALPDSCFVEDTAIIAGEKALICNMKVKSRAPEAAGVAKALEKFKELSYVRSPATIDGGDALRIEDRIFIGLTARTNVDAVTQIRRILKDTAFQVIQMKVRNVLHLKSACTYIGNSHVIVSRGNFDLGLLSGLAKIMVPKGEEYAADCLAINGTVLMAKRHPKTKKLLEDEGFRIEELDVSEFKKGDGALTCLSIVW